MRPKCFFLFGIPCCERLLPQKVSDRVSTSKRLLIANSITNANRFIVVGSLTIKQEPIFYSLWQQVSYPAKLIQLTSCREFTDRYSFWDKEMADIDPDFVSLPCGCDDALFEAAIEGSHERG